MATALKREWVRFGTFEADLANGELYRDGHRVALQRQPFAVLRMLLASPGEVVTREALRQRLWPTDTFVDFDAGLNAAIKRLRRALNDAAENPRFIATLPRRGYRFIAPVTMAAVEPPLPPVAAAGTRRHWKIPTVAASALSLAVLAYLLRPVASPPALTDPIALTPPGDIPADQELVTDGPNVYFAQVVAGGVRQLARVSAGGGEPMPLQVPFQPGMDTAILDISADGAELLVRVRGPQQNTLWEISSQGGAARRLNVANALDASWSPRRHELVFSRNKTLYTADTNGDHATALIQAAGAAFVPRWSPDGRHLHFTVMDSDQLRVQLWDYDAPSHRLQPLLPGWQVWDGVWSPDGRQFLFTPSSSPAVVWARRESSEWWRRTSTAPVALTSPPISFLHPTFSRDGSHVFAIGRLDRGELVRVDPRTRQLQPFLGGRSADALDYSRDGHWLAYVSYPDATLWRLDRRSGSLLQLTRGPERSTEPQWSSDSRQLTFTSEAAGQPARIMIASNDGSSIAAVTPAELDAYQQCWSPDNSRLAIVYRRAGTAEAWHMGILELRTRQLDPIPASEGWGEPRWSPDGRFLLARRIGPNGLAVYSFADRRWLPIAAPALNYPAWSADGRSIYFNTLGYDQPGIYRIRVTTSPNFSSSPAEKLVDLHDFNPAGTYGNWSGQAPDGSFLMMRYTGSSAIYRFDWRPPR